MNVVSWNCRGLGNSHAVRVLRDVIKSHKPDILFLMETLSNKEKINVMCDKLGFDNHLAVECVGRSGGVALCWKSKVKCCVNSYSNNFIEVEIMNGSMTKWRLTGFYGFLDRARRRESWKLLKSLADKSNLPWVVIGHFNDMLSINDKKGNHDHPQALLDGFKCTIEDCNLIELDLM